MCLLRTGGLLSELDGLQLLDMGQLVPFLPSSPGPI